ncbi:site-specific DNA-methyltransferase [bacterium]|jgi:tRNA G10  N-methylase Trm11|nr:site-specific DNA-methyltransferase [bacterium]
MATQLFKSIYFKEDGAFDFAGGKRVTVSFSAKEKDVYNLISSLTNEEIREIITVDTYQQLLEMASAEERTLSKFIKLRLKKSIKDFPLVTATDATFQSSKKIPFQRWLPYVEGYSPDFVIALLKRYAPNATSVFDPFAGTGTTVFAADSLGIKSYFAEVNPLLVFLSQTKIEVLLLEEAERRNLAESLLSEKDRIMKLIDDYEEDYLLLSNYRALFGESKYYDPKTFSHILKLRTYIDLVAERDLLLSKVLCVGVVAILLKVSYLKKVGDVRFKTKKELERESHDIGKELPLKISEIADDIANVDYHLKRKPEFLFYNSKKLSLLEDVSIDTVVTSPPYLNGTNYLRNTKIELWFLRDIRYSTDLRGLRNQILTSGINDVRAKNGVSTKEQNDFKSEILDATLIALRKNAYDGRIPVMVDSYFHEMYSVFDGMRYLLKKDSRVMVDIGDSIFAGVHIPTDKILAEILSDMGGYKLKEKFTLRKRRSRNQNVLTQELLVFTFSKNMPEPTKKVYFNTNSWNSFIKDVPHQKNGFSKKNWGHPNHSICSYGGKLKPAIARHLVDIFVPEKGRIFDPFSGVGTIPFEAALSERRSFGMDISKPAYYISRAKIKRCNDADAMHYLDEMQEFINREGLTKHDKSLAEKFGFNKKLKDYFEPTTLKEVLLARRFVKEHRPEGPSQMLVVASLLHILHGNRPYALSRRSHPITPYAPTGEFVYKNVYEKVKTKVKKSLEAVLPDNFCEGDVFLHDSTEVWPQDISDLDAIITSPPFFDSTRFYLSNWMRIWFCGWDDSDFKHKTSLYVEERQKKSFDVYDNIFRQGRERLKTGGAFVFHLGKSKKCDMAQEIIKGSKRYFRKYDLFDESVKHCQLHGIRDKGSVTSHQYLVLY